VIGILRRSLAIQDFSVLLSLDLRTPLSVLQVVGIIHNAKNTIESQIGEIHNEIQEAEGMSILSLGKEGKEVLNEEGLPIRDIQEAVEGEEEDGQRRVVSVEEDQPLRTYTMEEIDRMMDEALLEEQAELEAQKNASSIPKLEDSSDGISQKTKSNLASEDKENEKGTVKDKDFIAVAGEGLSVGTVNGDELLAKLVDDSKHRYNPLDGTWVEDEDLPEDSDEGDDEEDDIEEDDEEEEEEDQYGRTRGYLVPPYIFQKSAQPPSKGVKFSSFEKPATPSFPPPTSAPATTSGIDIKDKPLPLKPALRNAPTSAPFPPSPNPSFATFSTGTFSGPSSPDPSFSPMSSPNPSASAPLIASSRQAASTVMATSIVEREPQQIVPIPLVPALYTSCTLFWSARRITANRRIPSRKIPRLLER